MENQATGTEKTLEERLLTLENIGKEAISRLKQRIERLEENYYVRKEMLTTDEAARYMGMSKGWFQKLVPQFGLSSHAFRDIAFRVIGHSSYPKASDLL